MSNKEMVNELIESVGGSYIRHEVGLGFLVEFKGKKIRLPESGTRSQLMTELNSLYDFAERQGAKSKSMKRNYLNVPGQSVTITVDRGAAACCDEISNVILRAFHRSGVVIGSRQVGMAQEIVLTCPTQAQRQEAYLESLDDQQRETLRGHLDALGFDLEKQ